MLMKKINKFLAAALLALPGISASAVNFTIVATDDNALDISHYENDEYVTEPLVKGENHFDMEEGMSFSIMPKGTFAIASITDKEGNNIEFWGSYWYTNISADSEGQVWTVTTKDLDLTRTATFTLNVDDASLISVMRSSTNSRVEIVNGENTIKFDPETETKFNIYGNDYTKPIYKVTLDGEPVANTYGTYYIDVTQGCVVDVTAIIPAVPVTVTFDFADEMSREAISGVKVNDEAVDFNGSTVEVTAGQSISISGNVNYAIDEFTINGESQYWTGEWDYSVLIIDNTTISIKAHKYATFNITVNVTDPEYLTLMHGHSYNGTPIELTSTSNQVEVSENNTIISWNISQGCHLVSLTADGNPVQVDEYTNYITATEGMVLDFNIEKIVMDKTAVMWIDNKAAAIYSFRLDTATRDNLAANFEDGYNLFAFYNGYNPFTLSFYGEDGSLVNKVYLNGTLLEPNYEGGSAYDITAEDKAVIKVYLATEPVNCHVNVEMEEGVEASVITDIITVLADPTAGFDCFAGTQVNVAVEDAETVVSLNGEKLEMPADMDTYQFNVTEGTNNLKLSKPVVGIDYVSDEKAPAAVYNFQGIKVGNSLENLPAGIYIVNGKKVSVK